MSGKFDLVYRAAIVWLVLLVVVASAASWLPLPDPLFLDLSGSLSAPSARHLAGTDELGRDVLSRLLHAAQSTLLIVSGASALALAIGTALGGLAGYMGGWLDRAIRIGVDLFWSVPFVIFVVLIISVVGVSTTSLIITIGVINWVGPARVIRGEAARLRDADFVVAARAHGYSQPFILTREVVPNLYRTLLTLAAYGAVEVLTLETGLAFLGLSLPAPKPTWGGMLADGLAYFSSAWWVVIGTSAFVTITLGSLQVIARREEKGRSA